jgi:hypothetical protein
MGGISGFSTWSSTGTSNNSGLYFSYLCKWSEKLTDSSLIFLPINAADGSLDGYTGPVVPDLKKST